MLLGYTMDQIRTLDYFDAVQVSWSNFHARMATSGLFLGEREEIRLLPYGSEMLEGIVREYRARHINREPPEPVLIHDKAKEFPEWERRALVAVDAMTQLWRSLGLNFPALTTA